MRSHKSESERPFFSPNHAVASAKADGADGESRTHDLLITNQLLYQLSYIGLFVVFHGAIPGPALWL